MVEQLIRQLSLPIEGLQIRLTMPKEAFVEDLAKKPESVSLALKAPGGSPPTGAGGSGVAGSSGGGSRAGNGGGGHDACVGG